MNDEQEQQWLQHKVESHAKGLCEFSGKDIVECQRTICDCFESEEGARAIRDAAKE